MPVEAQVSPRHCPEVGETAVKQELQSCHPIQQYSVCDGSEYGAIWKVFHQQRQVVSEVEIRLAGRAIWQGAATYVIHLRLRAVHHLVVVVFHSPAEINFLHVGEETVVQAPEAVIYVGTYKHTCSCGPKHLFHVVVLSVVALQMLKHPAATERIAVFVDETATCTGIFELLLVVIREDFRLAGRYRRVAVHQLYHWLDPMWSHLDVGVQKTIILGLHLT